MSPTLTFAIGLLLLGLFAWYFTTDIERRKRWLGLVLTVFLIALCVEEIVPPSQKIRLGLDLQGGTSFLLRLVREQSTDVITKDMLDQAVEVIRKRVDQFGVSEPVITPQGEDRILVQIPGLDAQAMQSAKDQLQRVAKLEFAVVLPNSQAVLDQIAAGQAIMPPGYVVKKLTDTVNGKEQTFQLLVKKQADFSGEHIQRAFPFFDQQGYGVSLELDNEGAQLFDAIAAQNYGNQLAILLDGEVLSAPVLNARHYGGRAQITGRFSEKEARDLASALENPLRTPVSIEETRSVSPSLGLDSIKSGVLAGLAGLLLTVLFVFVYYRLAGLVAIVGLLINIVLLFGMMAMFNFVLTLPGIAGIILTIGMAVDANVLIYERLREEIAAGKSIAVALNAAYEKAFSAIFDANVTTVITAVILFTQASGPVRGFAVTLTLGIIASMFSALLVTRTAFRWIVQGFDLSRMRMLDLIPKRQFDFLGQRRLALLVSTLLILGSIVLFAVRGDKNFGIDFRGGDLLVITSQAPITVGEGREAAEKAGLGADSVIQMERSGTQELLTFRSPEGTSNQILNELQQIFPDRGVRAEVQDRVGAQIGLEFAKQAVFALGLGMLGILLYVTVRFEFAFALGAVAALVHDVIITLGAFSLIGGELSLIMVGAILTIAGYSINDTIVVFDRIREGIKMGGKGSILELMNRSINETLGRTILTGGTTFLSVAALYFFGGAVLRDFAFAILIGLTVGTYSSIFVASPLAFWWSKIRRKSIHQEVIENEALRSNPR